MSQESPILAAGRVSSKGINQKDKHEIPPHPNTPVSPQQLGNSGNIYTACDETRPTRLSILARFHRFRGYGSRPRTALAMSEDHEGYRYTDRRTDTLTTPWDHVHIHPGMKRLFCPIGKKQSRPRRSLGLASSLLDLRKPYTCSRPCAFEMKKRRDKHEIPRHPKLTSKSTAAQQPRLHIHGVGRNTSNVLTHTRPLP